MNFKFIGDLSIEDAKLLVELGRLSSRILEFGAGGSTQLFAQCKPNTLVTVETDPAWVTRTKLRLGQLEDVTAPEFVAFGEHPKAKFDLIFVDGVIELRKQFAEETWSLLEDGGVMVFHDTRRDYDFFMVADLAKLYFNTISKIDINVNNSNMTVIRKKPYQPYVNWNFEEGKPLWAYGVVPDTDDKPLYDLT